MVAGLTGRLVLAIVTAAVENKILLSSCVFCAALKKMLPYSFDQGQAHLPRSPDVTSFADCKAVSGKIYGRRWTMEGRADADGRMFDKERLFCLEVPRVRSSKRARKIMFDSAPALRPQYLTLESLSMHRQGKREENRFHSATYMGI